MDENHNLMEKLMRLQWISHRLRLSGLAAGGHMADTTRGQGRILALLKMQDGISTKDLSYLLGIRISSLNELLAKMEKNEYLTREPSESDKRIMLIRLTDKGRREEQRAPDFGSLFSCLSEEEQEAFGQYLDRITDSLQGRLGDMSDEEFDERTAHLREKFGKMRDGMHMMEKMRCMGGSFGGEFRDFCHGGHGRCHRGGSAE